MRYDILVTFGFHAQKPNTNNLEVIKKFHIGRVSSKITSLSPHIQVKVIQKKLNLNVLQTVIIHKVFVP